MRVLVTGSRDWPEDDPALVYSVMAGVVSRKAWFYPPEGVSPDPVMFVLGDCPRGVDKIAESACVLWKWPYQTHVADWPVHGNRAGPIRNQAMVDSGADLCLAFTTKPLDSSRGTADCVRRARAAGIPAYVTQRLAH